MLKPISALIAASVLAGTALTGQREAVHNGETHGIYTSVLARHVKQGLVDYAALCRDPRLDEYLRQLANENPDRIPSRKAQLAFWLNAYNAYTLKLICENYPVKSINDLHTGGRLLGRLLGKTVWQKEFVPIQGEKLSLDHIEHEIIRPRYRDPRIHFALVCAAVSCPPLRSEAYEGSRLDEQLDDQARIFLNDPQKNAFEVAGRKASLSRILDWYRGDFGADGPQLLQSIRKYLPAAAADSIAADPASWTIEHLPYDWSLNEVGR